ncbi:MAG: hypothetical protein RSC43_00625 [Clostridia bacterium]
MTQVTHDYTRAKRRWGHDLTYSPVDAGGVILKASGWGLGINKGDYILLSNGADETRYQFDSIAYYGNPHDMWSAVLVYAPRTSEKAA